MPTIQTILSAEVIEEIKLEAGERKPADSYSRIISEIVSPVIEARRRARLKKENAKTPASA